MSQYGITQADIHAFEQEWKDKATMRRYDGLVKEYAMTKSWFYCKSTNSAVLLPLSKVVAWQKDYQDGKYGSSFFVCVKFEAEQYNVEGSVSYRIPCEFRQLDEIAVALVERVPQANKRTSGVYL